MKKYLFIGNDDCLFRSIQSACPSTAYVLHSECTTTQGAIQVIAHIKPDVLFFDHELTPNGDEGFAIALWLIEHKSVPRSYVIVPSGQKLVHTGLNDVDHIKRELVHSKYVKLDIRHVDNLLHLKRLIASEEQYAREKQPV